jgi:DNA-binding transcriptional MerR regulator
MRYYPELGFSSVQAMKLAGCTYRQLDYWCRTGLIHASIQECDGPGTQRRFSLEDVVRLRVVKCLQDAGVSLQRIREALIVVDDGTFASDPLMLIADGTAYVCTSEEQLATLLRAAGAAMVVRVSAARAEISQKVAA